MPTPKASFSMPWLDCTDEHSALASLAGVMAVPELTLLQAICEYDDAKFEEEAGVSPDVLMPREVFGQFGTTTEQVVSGFAGAHYFHGTRTSEPSSFWRSGILTLAEALDQTWEMLHGLTKPAIPTPEWTQYRENLENGASNSHSAYLYRLKVGNPRVGGGPFARLIRAAHIDPRPPERDYLTKPPEIVEDIIRVLEHEHKVALYQRYIAATWPCLVKFRSELTTTTEVEAALWFVLDRCRDRRLSRWACQSNFSGGGNPIPAADILDVEVLAW
jgi:hypothetical protein